MFVEVPVKLFIAVVVELMIAVLELMTVVVELWVVVESLVNALDVVLLTEIVVILLPCKVATLDSIANIVVLSCVEVSASSESALDNPFEIVVTSKMTASGDADPSAGSSEPSDLKIPNNLFALTSQCYGNSSSSFHVKTEMQFLKFKYILQILT